MVVDDGVAVQHANTELLVTVTVNPTRRQLRDVLRSVLTNPHPRYRHVIYSGLALSGSGCWLLCDGPFTCDDFVAAVNAATSDDHNQRAPIFLGAFDGASWTPARLARAVPGLEMVISSRDEVFSSPEEFVDGLSRRIGVTVNGALLGTTDTVGTITFSRPTLYVFPAGDGGSSLFFGVADLSVVCDAGTGRRPAFWDFVRHVSHLDVLVGTHAGADNLFGLQSFVERQCSDGGDGQVLPKLGHVFFNGATDGAATAMTATEPPTLLVRLPEEIAKTTGMLRDDVGIRLQSCASPAGGKDPLKVNLYHNIVRGSVDLYVAHPVEDSRELKEFRRQCASGAAQFATQGGPPLTSAVSVVAALVWKPRVSTEKPARIFLPGAAPLAKVFEGLDRLQGVPLFESWSGPTEPVPRPVQQPAKPASSARPSGARQAGSKPAQQSMPAVKAAAPPAKARDQTAARTNVGSAPARKTVSKTEPPGKVERGAKPPARAQLTSADRKTKHVPEASATAAAATKERTSSKRSTKASTADNTEPQTDNATSVDVVVKTAKTAEPELAPPAGSEEAEARESAERDSLEASTVDESALVDSLCGDDMDRSQLHSEEEEIDPDRPIKTEKISEGNYGEMLLVDTGIHSEGAGIDPRMILGLDHDGMSPGLDLTSAGNYERVEPAGDWGSVVAEPSEEVTVPLDEAEQSRPVDAGDVDAEASRVKQPGLQDLMDTEPSDKQQEVSKEIERDERPVHQDLPVAGLPGDDKDWSDLLSSPTAQTTEPVLDESLHEPDDQRTEDLKVADIEPEEVHQDVQFEFEFEDKHSTDLHSDLHRIQQVNLPGEFDDKDSSDLLSSPTARSTEPVPDESLHEPDDPRTEDLKVADIPEVHQDAQFEFEFGDKHSTDLPSDLHRIQQVNLPGKFDDKDSSDLLSDLQQSSTAQSAEPVPESLHELDDQRTDDVQVADIEPEEVHQDAQFEFEFGDKHDTDMSSDLPQSPTVDITKPLVDEPVDEPDDQENPEDVEAASIEVDEERKEMDTAEREIVAAHSSISPPQGLPSPQKEAEWSKVEQEDPLETAFPPHDEATDLPHSLKATEENKITPADTNLLLTYKVDASEKIPEDHNGLMPLQHTSADYFDEPEDHDYQQHFGTSSSHESDLAVQNPFEDSVEKSDLQAETQHSHDYTVSTDLLPDDKAEEVGDTKVHDYLQPEVDRADFGDELMPDTDEPVPEEEELQTVTQKDSVSEEIVPDSRFHSQPSDDLFSNQELADLAVTTDEGYDDEKEPASPQRVETSEPENLVETEGSLSGLMDAHDQDSDDFHHDADIPDVADDVPVSPVERSSQDLPPASDHPSFCYTEPQIQLSGDLDRASDTELPIAADFATGTADDGQAGEPQAESRGPDAVEDPYDPVQSWDPPMGLPAPLKDDGEKKRESKESGARGAAAGSAPRTDARSSSAGKSGSSRDSSAGQNGRATTRTTGKPAERPPAAPTARKLAAPAADAKKVNNLSASVLFVGYYFLEAFMYSDMLFFTGPINRVMQRWANFLHGGHMNF